MVEEGGAAVSPEPRAEHGPGLRTQMARTLASACYKSTFHIHTHHSRTHMHEYTHTHVCTRVYTLNKDTTHRNVCTQSL